MVLPATSGKSVGARGCLLFLAVMALSCDSSDRRETLPEPGVRSGDSVIQKESVPAAPAATPYRVVTRRIDEKSVRPVNDKSAKLVFEIAMEYPAIDGAQMNTSRGNFNRMVADSMDAVVTRFRQQISELTPHEGELGELGSSLRSSYTVASATPELISVAVVVSQYEEGAAHPGSSTWTFTYDLANDRPVALRNLFLPQASYLDTISKMSIDQLSTRLGEYGDPEMIREGAGAREENFRNFTLGGDSLMVDFDEYQIGPYALGRQQVAIAYTSLSTILSPDGPVAHTLGRDK